MKIISFIISFICFSNHDLPVIATVAASGSGSINVEINLRNVLCREIYTRANTN